MCSATTALATCCTKLGSTLEIFGFGHLLDPQIYGGAHGFHVWLVGAQGPRGSGPCWWWIAHYGSSILLST